MSTLIINGVVATLPQQQMAAFHGNSVFTTFRSRHGEALLWNRHWHRVTTHAQFFGFAIPDENVVKQLINEQLKQSSTDQKIRIIISAFGFALTVEPLEKVASAIYQGVSIVFSQYTIHPQFGKLKTANTLPYVMASQEAKQALAFEALLLNQHGHVVDGARTSLMCFDGTSLIALEGGLAGCMREEVLAYALSHNIPIARKFLLRHEIMGQLLLANSLMGVVPVNVIQSDVVAHLVEHFRP